MATSYVFYPNETGARTDYPIPFEYLSSTFVKATVNGASVPFSLLSTYMIRFTTAPLGALKIYRQTSSAPVNTFTNGSILVDTQLNGSFLQSLHVSEEVTDNSLQTASDGAWDAANLKVKNVADPTSAKDAANKSYVDARLSTDKGEIDAAKVAAEAAAADASFSKTAAGSAASSAANSAGAAGASATNASNSATAANNSATLAWYYAMQPEDVAIPGGGFSALHYAAKAAAALGSMLNGLAGWIHGATSKTTPVDNDEVAISDSAATWGLKKVSWASVKGTLKTYFDTLYSATGHTHTFASLTSKPNTISGYGITDAAAKSDGDDSTAVAGTSTTQKTWPATSLKAGALAFTLGAPPSRGKICRRAVSSPRPIRTPQVARSGCVASTMGPVAPETRSTRLRSRPTEPLGSLQPLRPPQAVRRTPTPPSAASCRSATTTACPAQTAPAP